MARSRSELDGLAVTTGSLGLTVRRPPVDALLRRLVDVRLAEVGV